MPELNTKRTSSPQDTRLYAVTTIALLVALLFTRSYSYLLFHSLAEMMTVAFAFTIFLLAWNTLDTIENDYVKVICIGFAAAACIDLIHTLAFKGMNIFTGFDANLPTQLWILENLLNNAFRYTPSDGAVLLDVRREKNLLCMEIRDNGIGIPEEEQKLIYEAFYR